MKGARNLAKICCANDILIFYISTDYVFDGKKQHPYVETDNTAPLNVYGRTKEAGEIVIRRVTKKHIILRTSWVFSSSKSSFVNKILNMALEGRSLTLVADQIGGPTPANSVAATLLDLVSNYHKYDESYWGTYHFSQYPFMSRYDFAIEILDTAVRQGVLSKRPTVTPTSSSKFHTAASRPANSRLHSERIRVVFGLKSNEWRDDLESAVKVLSNNLGN